jgi:MoaA/NifB/PqqE/SkfB family radical SAM enzyme
MEKELFLGLPRYLKDVTEQVALGGGEPTLYPDLVEQFTRECRDYDLVCNLTTNGYLIKDWKDEKVERFSENLTMTSVSLDKSKYKHWRDRKEFLDTFKKLQKHTLVGCNLLTDHSFFQEGNLVNVVDILFDEGFDRVFSLYPKNVQGPDILDKKHYVQFLTMKYPNFYIDDLTFKILDEGKYENWSKSCHYGKDIVSINEKGQVSGCSFSNEYKLKLEKPRDILKINDVCFEDRHSCPYLRR